MYSAVCATVGIKFAINEYMHTHTHTHYGAHVLLVFHFFRGSWKPAFLLLPSLSIEANKHRHSNKAVSYIYTHQSTIKVVTFNHKLVDYHYVKACHIPGTPTLLAFI